MAARAVHVGSNSLSFLPLSSLLLLHPTPLEAGLHRQLFSRCGCSGTCDWSGPAAVGQMRARCGGGELGLHGEKWRTPTRGNSSCSLARLVSWSMGQTDFLRLWGVNEKEWRLFGPLPSLCVPSLASSTATGTPLSAFLSFSSCLVLDPRTIPEVK
jgi:hypothetical protein